MPLSWNEIRARAARFAEDWKGAHYEKGQTQTFYNEFFEVFGRRRRDVAIYEQKVKLLDNSRGFIDLFWPGQLLIEQKSAGLNLTSARSQASDYFLSLKEQERPRYILLSDFQTFEMIDLETREEFNFKLSELHEKVRLFDFVAGYQRQQYRDQDPANIEAASLMSNLHQRLEENGYTGTDLERLLVRIMFCLFADDTGIFDLGIFLQYVEGRTSEDGSDLGSRLVYLFEVLDTSPERRQRNLDEDLARFPYVNGQLFADPIRTPSFNASMRKALLECCYFSWSKVSPALFGSLFQTVMLPEEQRAGGAHYTSERNILKTIHPLFLDELRDEFVQIKGNRSNQRHALLEKFQARLGTLTFLDPACGCGNFLILAYRELRILEIEVIKELYPDDQLTLLDVKQVSKIDVDQFYGIEIEEFPVRIAEAAMWLVDHQMNMRLSQVFGQPLLRLPLKKSAHIVHGNALRLDWQAVIASGKLSYMLGNPPFVGARKKDDRQSQEMADVFAGVKGFGDLDYVAAWYMKAAQFIQGTRIKVAFVSTNSISQGEQVSILWQPLLTRYGISIHFAHRTFKWTIDEKKAKGMNIAAVYCVIVGFAAYVAEKRYLFEYETLTSDPHRVEAKRINPYLVDAAEILITARRSPICDVPEIVFGNMPNDGGHLLFSDTEKVQFLLMEPKVEKFMRPLLGSHEFINGIRRWCLWLKDAQPNELKTLPYVLARLEQVKAKRLASDRPATKKLASMPALFGEIRHPKGDYLLIPKTSSERRHYIPMGVMPNAVIPTECLIVPDAGIYHFGVLTSLMHMTWVRYVCGRLKSDYRYSNTLVYNNFPWPQNVTSGQMQEIEAKGQAVLDARGLFPDSTLADLYDPLTMPLELLKAHQSLDRVVDAAYRKQSFTSERERVEYLFTLYQGLVAPLIAAKKSTKRQS